MSMHHPPKTPKSTLGGIFGPLVPRGRNLDLKGYVLPLILGLIECTLVVVVYPIVSETYSALGIEFDVPLYRFPIIGWLFESTPEVTAQHPMAFLTAVIAVVVPIFFFITRIDVSVLKIPARAAEIGRRLSAWIFLLLLACETGAVVYRAIHGGGFHQKDDLDIALGILFGMTSAALTVCVGYATATVICARAQRKT